MSQPSLKCVNMGIEKPITVKQLFEYLDTWSIRYDIWVGVDAKRIADILGQEYPYQKHIIGPHNFTGEFDGSQISHFITVADNLVVWAVFGTGFSLDGPDYHMGDFVARLK